MAIEPTPASTPGPGPGPGSSPRTRWSLAALEVATALAASTAYFASCLLIRINPLDRMGQVAGLAALAYRFLWFAVPAIVALIVVARRWPARWELAVRLVCAGFAGVTSAVIAGGIWAMLRGTPFGLAGDTGDSSILAGWAELLQQGEDTPGLYPPLQIHLIAWLSQLQDLPPLYAVKSFQVLAAVLFGPLSYAAWRLVLRPMWALGLGIVLALPLLEAYRMYPMLALAVFMPLMLSLLDHVRHAPASAPRALVIRGAAHGVALGVVFLLYSGWFQWSAPGVLVAGAWIFPWRTGWRRGALIGGAAALGFAVVAGYSIGRVLAAPPIADLYQYFDSTVDPMYVAMWRGGLPGVWEKLWPMLGELGGVGVFTVALCAGCAGAIALGARRTSVLATTWILVGTWFLRLYHAHRMWQTKRVQLYPRTTAELLYCMLALTGLAIWLYAERRAADAPDDSPLRTPWGTIGALCGMTLLVMTATSAIVDRYMPRDITNDYSYLAYLSHHTAPLDKTVTRFAQVESSTAEDPDGPTSARAAIDEIPDTVFGSAPSTTEDQDEWIMVTFPRLTHFSKVALIPAIDAFPVDFTIEVWDSQQWLPRVTRTNYHVTDRTPQVFSWTPQDQANRIRLHVTKLGRSGDHFALRLAEFQVFR
ncbi:MAG TPA: discoidin domain-containing protein [Kofleriaceae bacterium]|nr:discoidin domain-containing protein [Kofleriaceae bacterium]